MPQLSGLLETSLYVEDLERSSRFYRTLFGFESLFADTRLHALSVTGGHVLLLFKKRGSLELSTPHDGDGNLHVAFAILATPEYHGGSSGVLKNALDLMGFDEFEGKMVGLVGVSGGRMGAVDALNTLRNIGRALHAWVVRWTEQAGIEGAQEVGRGVERFR